MKSTAQKESTILGKIADTVSRLDESLGKMETTDSRLMGFVEQEKAIHEMKKTVREAEHLDWVDGTWDDGYELDEGFDAKQMGKALIKIDRTLGKLDDTLDALDDDDNGRLKQWFEQRKAIHEVKRILNKMDLFDAYDEDEMDMYA